MKLIINSQRGQALVTLLFFMMIGIAVTSSAIAVLLTNALGTSYSDQGTQAYYIAESGVEDGVIHLLRNPSYTTSGYTLSIGGGTASIQVSGGVITSTGTLANTVIKIQATTVYNNNVLTVSSWKQIN